MEIIDKSITTKQLTAMAQKMFGNLVKAVVDIKKEINRRKSNKLITFYKNINFGDKNASMC